MINRHIHDSLHTDLKHKHVLFNPQNIACKVRIGDSSLGS